MTFIRGAYLTNENIHVLRSLYNFIALQDCRIHVSRSVVSIQTAQFRHAIVTEFYDFSSTELVG